METANLVLRSGKLPDDSYQALDAELARLESDQAYRHALVTERPFGLQGFRDLNQNSGWGPVGMPWVKNEAYGYLNLIGELISLADQPYEDAKRVLKGNAALAAAGPLTHSLIPVLESTLTARCRASALTRALRVLGALLRRPDADAPVSKLSDLGLGEQSTTDPFNGLPLRLKKTPQGWLIYSVGTNLEDDGGDQADQKDIGLGPPSVAEEPQDAKTSKPRTE